MIGCYALIQLNKEKANNGVWVQEMRLNWVGLRWIAYSLINNWI